jgi:FixJ family two-component response regulator
MSGGIFLVGDDDDLRLVLVDLIGRATGRQVLGLRTLAELREQREAVLGCSLGILDINLGSDEPSGLDAFAWLRAERFAGRVVFLTGHATSNPLVRRAGDMDGATVLSKPLSIDTLLELLK